MTNTRSSESQKENKKDEKENAETQEERSNKTSRIHYSIESLKEQMKVTNEELQYRTKNFDTSLLKEHSKYFKCTKCKVGFQGRINKGAEISTHPLLGVLMCASCCEYYGNGEFSLDSEGEDKYCRWCGQGGTLFSCSKCICAFCKLCIQKHFNVSGLKKVIDDDDWVCYFCNPEPLWHLRAICSLAKEISESKRNELKSKQEDDKIALEKNKRANESSESLSSSDHNKSSTSNVSVKLRRRRLRKSLKSRKFEESSSSSSEDEKENEEITLKKRKRDSSRKHSKSLISSEDEESTPSKRFKEETKPISPSEKNKLIVIDKLRGIWKLTQIVAKIGLKWSKERLKKLSKPDDFKNLDDLEKEYGKLNSVTLMLSSSINKICDSVGSLKNDLNCENVKDESHVFRCEEANFKSLAKKLADESVSSDRRLSEKNIKKTKNESEGLQNQSHSLFSAAETESENETDEVSASDDGENSEDNQKPVLKVKDFAKMKNDNILDGATRKEKADDDEQEKNKDQRVSEYDVETEGSSDIEEVATEKKKKKIFNDSDYSETKRGRGSTRSQKKDKDLESKFEKFKEKREKYLKSVSQNKVSPPRRSCRENVKKKIEFLESSEESDNDKNDKKIRKSNRKRKTRKKILSSNEESGDGKGESESEASVILSEANDKDSDSESSWSNGKKRGKWKRIRKNKEKTEESSKSGDEEGKKGRKNIRKILNKDSLKLPTKEALKKEEERRKKIEERRKIINEIEVEYEKGECDEGENSEKKEKEKAKKLILDYDPETKKPLVVVHEKLVKKLKPHQVEGVRFMWDNCFGSVEQLEKESGSGCILAHYMGLGKTFQVVTLVHTVMTHDIGVYNVLVICPLGTVNNWLNEFEHWLGGVGTDEIPLYELITCKTTEAKRWQLREWQNTGGVMVISYDLFRTMINQRFSKKFKNSSSVKSAFVETLLDPGPDLVVCDEGHLLKNEDTALSKCVNQIKTSRRIVLTGTPLQNNLREYHCMVQFVKPNILGTKKEFSNRFINPITNGQFEDSTEHDVKVMKRRSHVLHSMLEGCVQRCDYSVLTPYLPEKQEYVLSISLTEGQTKAYRFFVENLSTRLSKESKTAPLFNDYHNLQRIWTHPRALLMHKEKEEQRTDNEVSRRGNLKNFVVDSDEATPSTSYESNSDNSVESIVCEKKVLRSNASDLHAENNTKTIDNLKNEWWSEYFKDSDYEDIRASNKILVLFFLLKQFEDAGDKTLVFSQSLYSLSIIEYFLNKIDDLGEEGLAGFKSNWVHGVDYFRLDGATSSDLRASWCKTFNSKSNKRARLFLISTKAGGLGINLYSANRVIVFDASWNPSHDLQSIFRVYRFGQKKTCYVYRFLAEATMEEKIYERQVTKLSLSHRVVDEQQIERHYSMINLQELYTFMPTPKEMRKTPKVPKDQILGDLLVTYKDAIVGYHEHDSLLENKEEEELTEEERKAAWQEFEQEKEQRANFMDLMALQNQMNPGYGMDVNNSPLLAISLNTQIPIAMLERAFQVGLVPFNGESPEAFTNRVLNRELLMGRIQREA